MTLNNSQKKYLKKNIHTLSLRRLSGDLNLTEKQILKYLKKKWRKDKYEKFIYNNSNEDTTKFDLGIFFQKNQAIFIGLALLVFIVYLNSINNEFVSDDIPAIAQNKRIGNLRTVFSLNIIFGGIQRLIHFIIFHLNGINPAFYRFVNIILHAGSVLTIYTLLNIISKKRVALIVAILFAVHPILTESVTWISGMPYALSSLPFFLSFLVYILVLKKYINKNKIYLSYFLFFLALVSSEKIIPLFLIFILFEFLFNNLKVNWKKITPYFILSFSWFLLYLTKVGDRITDLKTDYYQTPTSNNPFLEIPIAITNYLKLIFWPQKLSLYHTEMSFSLGGYFFMLFIFILFMSTFILAYKKNKMIFFWLSFFIISLLPTLLPLGISWIVAERYVYLGSLGIFVIIAIGADWLIKKSEAYSKIYKQILYSIFILIAFALSIRTIIRNNDWQNQDTLWIATAKTSPSGANIHNNLGDVYSRQKNYPKAIEEFKKAIEINKGYADAYHNLAYTYQTTNQLDEAIENYKKAVELNPRLWQSRQNLAILYFNQENYQLALEYIRKAIEINPEDKNLKQNLEVIENKIKEIK